MLDASHDYWLVAASLAVALMAGFTGLSLTRGASKLSIGRRKVMVALSAISLGGGIWSMHFVAMLGLQLPFVFYYDPLVTLLSALVAILVVGAALLLLHFRKRETTTIAVAGAIVGVGILAMHYIGMSGIQRCLPIYTPFGVGLAVVASIGLSIAAFWIAYGKRTHRNIVLGTLGFGFAVFGVHFIAMAGTSFVAVEATEALDTFIGNETLAFVVTLGSFVICGAFLLNFATFLPVVENTEASIPASNDVTPTQQSAEQPVEQTLRQVPYEKEGRTFFLRHDEIAAVRAEGHYTILYNTDEKLFCPWSISEAARRLPSDIFVRAHRSYLVNPAFVSSFERRKDNGVCYFESCESLDKVPVSRSRLQELRETLGLA